MKRILFALLPLALFISSCDFVEGIRGNGNIKKENRSVGSFSSVDAESNFEVHITQGAAADIRIETDENLMQYIIVKTEGDELKIYTKDNSNLRPSDAMKVYVSAPAFKDLRGSGACRLIGETKLTGDHKISFDLSGASTGKFELSAPEVYVDLSGASEATLKGETKSLTGKASGASTINGYDLMSETADINADGASDARIFASVSIKGDASGASSIKYKGSATMNASASGASSVSKAD